MEQPEPWTIFRDILLEATALVTEPYFHLQQYQSPTIYRERVYCYELYHQFRCLQTCGGEDLSSYVMHAEVEKSAHECFKKVYGIHHTPSPDFIIHVPGQPDNLAVIEVKTSQSSDTNIIKDIPKLQFITEKMKYQHGVLLIFGETAGEIIDKLPDLSDTPQVSVIIHPECGKRAYAIKNHEEW